MSWTNWLVWGFIATAVLTTLMAGSEGLGITRMNIPHMLGTMFTPNRDRAKVHGVLLHFLNGWAFSIVYIVAFHTAHIFTWWFGALLGLLHGAFVAAVALPVMPGVHPRMASELRGPTVGRQLEPPGFLGLNYGVRTPISVLIAHVAFGALLGALYSPRNPAEARRVAVAPQASIRSAQIEKDDGQPQQDQGRHHRDRQISPGAGQPVAALGLGRLRPARRGLSTGVGHGGRVLEIAQELPRAILLSDRHLDGHRRQVPGQADQRAGRAPEARRDPLVAEQLGDHLALRRIRRVVDDDVAVVGHRPCPVVRGAPRRCFCTFPMTLRGSSATSSSARGNL
jgi:hypothetical protein